MEGDNWEGLRNGVYIMWKVERNEIQEFWSLKESSKLRAYTIGKKWWTNPHMDNDSTQNT